MDFTIATLIINVKFVINIVKLVRGRGTNARAVVQTNFYINQIASISVPMVIMPIINNKLVISVGKMNA
jgi:hypothetical protein